MGRARWLYNNVGFVKGAVKDIARYSVGSGFIPQCQISDQDTRKQYEEFWRQWSQICEVTGRLTFNELLHLASVAIDVDGDIGFILTETDTNYPQLMAIESHRITGEQRSAGFDGVDVSETGQPLQYWIDESQSMSERKYKAVAARDFALVAELDRVDEQRGKSRLHAAITRLVDVWETLEAETTAIKTNAKIALAIETDDASPNPIFGRQQTIGSQTTGTVMTEDIYAGAIPRLKKGEKLWAHETNRPNPTFTGYMDYLGRDVAAGLGVPIEFIWNAESMGGVTQRFIMQKAQRRFCERQETLKKFASRIWGWVVSKAVKRGDLPYSDEWYKVRWQMPSRITVDVGREAQQAREDIKLGLKTVSDDAAERGMDIDELRDQIEKEATDLLQRADRMATTTGKPFELCLSLLSNRTEQISIQTSQNNDTQPANS